jgi:hypothetical protein
MPDDNRISAALPDADKALILQQSPKSARFCRFAELHTGRAKKNTLQHSGKN